MFSRRSFIRAASLLSAATLGDWYAASAMPEEGGNKGAERKADDEAFWSSIRKGFPLDKDWAYLNNGTLGPSPYPVIEAVTAGMMETDRYGHYNGYEEAAKRLAAFTGAAEDEIALTHNTTEGINIACRGLPLQRGDEVIITTHEHVGNAFPWLNRRKQDGIVLKAVAPATTAVGTLERIATLLTQRTRAIAVPHILCTQGQVLPVKEICRLAKDKGIYSAIDGAHGAGMLPLDLHDIGCDTYAGCCHKWMLGPKGTGFLYVRKDFQDTLQPLFVGGGGETGVWNTAVNPIKGTEYTAGAHRYYGGTQNLGLWKGVIAAINFLEDIGMQNIHRRVQYLGRYTQERLSAMGSRIELLTPGEPISRCAITGFRIAGVDYQHFFNQCMGAKVRIRGVGENRLNSLRISTHIYNSKADIDRLMDEVRKS